MATETKLLGKKMLAVAAVAVAAVFCAAGNARAEDEESAPEASAAEAPPPVVVVKKKGPTKLPEYKSFAQAAEIAAAWDQPVVVFVGIEGDKKSNQLRMATVGSLAFREICPLNGTYYSVTIPLTKVKKDRRGRPVKNQKRKPELDEVKSSEQKIVKSLVTKKNPAPFVAVVSSQGAMLGTLSFNEEDRFHLARMVDDLKAAFERGKYTFTVSKKLQKELDSEAKEKAKLEKQKKY